MEEILEFTRTDLIKAFNKWNIEFSEHPEDFQKEPCNYNAEHSADYLIELIKGA